MEVKRLETVDGAIVGEHIAIAKSMVRRTLGLMFRRELPAGHGLAINPCNSIHMFCMRFPIDVVFVDREGRVLHALHGIRPWRLSRIVRGARTAVELPAGTLRVHGVEKGDHLRLV